MFFYNSFFVLNKCYSNSFPLTSFLYISLFFILIIFTFFFFFFFFNDTATTEIYTLSLHDALPIFLTIEGSADLRRQILLFGERRQVFWPRGLFVEHLIREGIGLLGGHHRHQSLARSEEHTSELQSHSDLVCRLLLGKKKK